MPSFDSELQENYHQIARLEKDLELLSDDIVKAIEKSPLRERDILDLRARLKQIQEQMANLAEENVIGFGGSSQHKGMRSDARHQNTEIARLNKSRTGIFNTIKAALEAAGEMLEDLGAKIKSGAVKGLNNIKTAFEKIFAGLKDFIGKVFTDADSYVKQFANKVKNGAEDFKDAVSDFAKKASIAIREFSTNVIDYIKLAALTVGDAVSTALAQQVAGESGVKAALARGPEGQGGIVGEARQSLKDHNAKMGKHRAAYKAEREPPLPRKEDERESVKSVKRAEYPARKAIETSHEQSLGKMKEEMKQGLAKMQAKETDEKQKKEMEEKDSARRPFHGK